MYVRKHDWCLFLLLICCKDRFPNKSTDPERLIHFQKALDHLTGVSSINLNRKTAFERIKTLMDNKDGRMQWMGNVEHMSNKHYKMNYNSQAKKN